MPAPSTSISIKGIASVLSYTRHQVPTHQRPFEWTEGVQEFLDDVGDAFGRKEDYFLGSLVVIPTPEAKRTIVLDGQQRLAVITLLIASIADRFDRIGEKKTCQEIRREYIAKYDISDRTLRPQLSLNRQDDAYFRSIINREASQPARGAPESYQRLWDADCLVAEWLSKKTADVEHPENWLVEFIEYLTNSAYVIYFTVPDDANAFLIFETMNDRGLDLSVSDLLKNYLLGHAGEDIETVLNLWNTAMASLRAYGGEYLFTVFLRHFWISKYGIVREKDLYRSIKSRISTSANVMDFANELVRNSYLYAAILSSEHEFWSESSTKARENISTLSLLGLEQYRPMLLSTLAHLRMEEVEKLLRLLISWSVRLLVVGGLGGGVIENNYCLLAQAIRNGKLKTAREVASQANKSFVPNDGIFQESFRSIRVSKTKLVRYYLRVLELQGKGISQHELLPNPDPSELNLEHVLPENPAKGSWSQFSEEERRAYTRRIGNMLLLTERMNSKLRNNPYDEKCKIYAKSDLILTKEVAKYDEWTKEVIEERQKTLAELAVKAWNIKP